MNRFDNKTVSGNEKAIKRGKTVPDGAVNVAWVKSPKLTPQDNIIIVDTSQVVAENNPNDAISRRIMYANSLGILEDQFGNQVIDDEYPSVSDIFTVNEDFSSVPGSEYKPEDILPFVHISRYFHVDFVGLTMGSAPQTYKSDEIKVIDSNGRHYVDDNGNPRYRIQIAPANTILGSAAVNAAYRVWLFIDTDQNEDLYLAYNKIEVTSDGQLRRQDISYKEIINPVPYFSYRPEESDVIDPANVKKKIYSTKPVALKEQILNLPRPDGDGYKVYVPKKAVEDTRIFQLFRWRVRCDFIETAKLNPASSARNIKCGVVVTNTQPHSFSPYVFYNMMVSDYNATSVNFINPLQTSLDNVNQIQPTQRQYWEVNFDTISHEDLAKFDILVWAPTSDFDFQQYGQTIEYFANTLGRTLILDTSNMVYTTGLGITPTAAIFPKSGSQARRTTSGTSAWIDGESIIPVDLHNILFEADAKLGGWNFNDGTNDEYMSLSPYITGAYETAFYSQYIESFPADYQSIAKATTNTSSQASVVIQKSYPTGGNIVFSSIGIASACNVLYSHQSGKFVDSNQDVSISSNAFYNNFVSGAPVEGAYKFFFNLCLLSVKNRIIDNSDDTAYSTTWTFTSPWYASWVINGEVLAPYERATSDFVNQAKSVVDATPIWQRKLSGQTLKEIIDTNITSLDKTRVQGASRIYSLEVTNPEVETSSTLGDNSYPTAWTEAYTPEFIVPLDLGPYIIREDPIQGNYEASQYTQYSYPPKPYGGYISIKSIDTAQMGTPETVTWTVTGTATRQGTPADFHIASLNTDPVEVTMSWATDGDKSYYTAGAGGGRQFDFGFPNNPNGIRLYTEDNYYTMGGGPNLNWPYWGVTVRIQQGSTGEWVSFLQDAMNKFYFYRMFDTGSSGLDVDGVFGPLTKRAVQNYQAAYRLKGIDGTVDAETWYSIGTQIVRLGSLIGNPNPNNYERFYFWPINWILKQRISDGLAWSQYAKKSWTEGGPSVIWESFAVQLPSTFNIHAVTVIPYVEGATGSVWVGAVDIKTYPGICDLNGYDASKAMLSPLFYRPVDQELLKVPFTPIQGNTAIVTIGQDGPMGQGTARLLGVRDIRIHATVQNAQANTKPTIKTEQVTITRSGTITVVPGADQVFSTTFAPTDTDRWTYTKFSFDSLSLDNSNVIGTMDSSGKVSLKNIIVSNYSGSNFTYGPAFGRTAAANYYSINEHKLLNPMPETGWVLKSEGIKLLCNADKTPYGFPSLPTLLGANESARHYSMLSIIRTDNDPSVFMAFYDVNTNEFIIDSSGQSSMSYVEYMQRGPQNVFVGVVSSYQIETKATLPAAQDAPQIPHKWAMPVYGISTNRGSQISIQPLPIDLDPSDVWPVPIRAGKFNRSVSIRPTVVGALHTYISDHQGTTVKAFYNVVETEFAGWSNIYGRPNVDVKAEHPIVIDQDAIRVRQAPFLMIKEPTAFSNDADPVRPVFTVYKKNTPDDPWVQVQWSEIKDFNASNGTIYLETPLESFDPTLLKVDYTSSRPVFNFKQYDGNRLNLNPYPGHNRDLIGRPIYLYILPAYVKDETGTLISESVLDRTVRFTIDPTIFDPLSPNYDPLAVQLGVIYITSALDINDMIVLDTRRRGGGAKDSLLISEIQRLASESLGFWDIGFGSGIAYQKGGFVIVRLPAELKTQFPNPSDIINIIQKNITLGVQFKIEDLNGNAWN